MYALLYSPRKAREMTLEELRDCYKTEAERRDKLSASLTLPVGVLTVIGGLIGFLSKEFSYQSSELTPIFIILLGASILAFITSAVLLILAYYRYTYEYVPTPRNFREHEDKVRAHFSSAPGATEVQVEGQTRKHVDAMAKRLYENAIEVNTKNNDTKAGYMHNSVTFLIVSLAFIMVATIPYAIDSRTKKKEIPEVRITNLEELVRLKEVPQNDHRNAKRREPTHGAQATRAATGSPRTTAGSRKPPK